ncbi:hypothetical protein BsWGS_23511 [Bradybaena similaris]
MIAVVTLVPDNHLKAAVIAAISILILDVVDLYAPLCSVITLLLILAEKPLSNLPPRCTKPSVSTTVSSSLTFSHISWRTTNNAVPLHHSLHTLPSGIITVLTLDTPNPLLLNVYMLHCGDGT